MVRQTTSILLICVALAGALTACTERDPEGARACFGGQTDCLNVNPSSGTGSVNVPTEPMTGVGSIPTATNSNSLYCQARPSKTSVRTREVLAVTFTVSGGRAPYRVNGYFAAYGFARTATFWGSYNNNGLSDIITNRTPRVTDANGATVVCPFQVVVRGQATTAPSLTCTLTSTPSTVTANQSVTFNVTASGASTYEFVSIEPQPGWVHTPTTTNGNTAQLVLTGGYTTGGSRVARAVVRSGNSYAECTTTQNVSQLGITLASTGDSVAADGEIRITATPSGFPTGAAIQYEYTADPLQYVSLNPQGNVVIVTNGDTGSSRDFNLRVRAFTADGATVTSEPRRLRFGGSSALACAISGPAKILKDVTKPYQVATTATSPTAESLTVTQVRFLNAAGQVVVGDGVLIGSTTNPFSVKFTGATAGVRTIQVKAQGAISGTKCNNDEWVGYPVTMNLPFPQNGICSVSIYEGAGRVGDQLTALSALTPGYGIGPFHLEVEQGVYNCPPNANCVIDPRLEIDGLSNGADQVQTIRFLQASGQPAFPGGVVVYFGDVIDDGNPDPATNTTYCGNQYYLQP